MDTGLIVDLETTGIDCETDKIIEIGIVEFKVDPSREPEISRMYSAVEDPGEPITPEISKLTGLSDSIVKDQTIDWKLVLGWLTSANIVIAHNAEFDRGFLMKRPELAGIKSHWACSLKHIDWAGHGYKTKALNYLAADNGFVNPFAHRALFDCATTFRLIKSHLPELIQRSFMREFQVFATAAPFESKDKLKGRHYRWDAQKRVWFKSVFEDGIEAERQFLADEVYPDVDLHEEMTINP